MGKQAQVSCRQGKHSSLGVLVLKPVSAIRCVALSAHSVSQFPTWKVGVMTFPALWTWCEIKLHDAFRCLEHYLAQGKHSLVMSCMFLLSLLLWSSAHLCDWPSLPSCLQQLLALCFAKCFRTIPIPENTSFCCYYCLIAQLCLTFCYSNPMVCSLPCFSVHEISQARILEWVAIAFSRGSSWPRDQTCFLAAEFYTTKPPGKPKTFCRPG